MLADDGRKMFTTRPSGTQPQFKHYIQHYCKVDGDLEDVKKEVDLRAEEIEKSFFEYQDKILGKKIPGHKFVSNW